MVERGPGCRICSKPLRPSDDIIVLKVGVAHSSCWLDEQFGTGAGKKGQCAMCRKPVGASERVSRVGQYLVHPACYDKAKLTEYREPPKRA